MSNPKTYQRFMDKIKTAPDGCWEWQGSKKQGGYGLFRGDAKAKGAMLAHRFSYAVHKGIIPEGFEVHHICRNPSCVNPAHLEALAPLENQKEKRRCPNCGFNIPLYTKKRKYFPLEVRTKALSCRMASIKNRLEEENDRH